MDDFLIRAAVAGVGVAAAAGPLGAFVVWRRMAYFGDTLAHMALLGIALGLLAGIAPVVGAVGVGVAGALVLVAMQRRRSLAVDTVLGILAHGGLALGLVALAFLDGVRVDLMSYLFGDILAVTASDVAWVWGGGALVLAVLAVLWRPLLSVTVHQELAFVEGVPVGAVQFAFMVLLAVVVALAMKVVGVLLVTALVIIPPAAARPLARTPEAMAVLAAAAGTVAVVGGLAGSWVFDIPAGPAIVVAALGLFVLGLLVPVNGRR